MKAVFSKNNKIPPKLPSEKFPLLFLTVALILTGTVFIWFTNHIYHSRYVRSEVEKRVLKTAELRGAR